MSATAIATVTPTSTHPLEHTPGEATEGKVAQAELAKQQQELQNPVRFKKRQQQQQQQQKQMHNEALQASIQMVVAHEKRLLEEEEDEGTPGEESDTVKELTRVEKKEDADKHVDDLWIEDGEENSDILPCGLSGEEIAKELLELCKTEKYKFKDTQIRNVLIVGRSRSGKTTVVNTLKTVENTTAKLSVFAGTAAVNFRSFSLSEPGFSDYTINIIDTPGLFEIVQSHQVARTDEEITKMIADCLRHEITKIHVIILTCSIEAGINLIDVQAMQKMIRYFGNDVNMAICVTRAEGMRLEERKRFKEELKKNKEFGGLIGLVRNHICFMGAIDPLRVSSKEMLKGYYDQISKDRKFLLDFIFRCKRETKINELKFVAEKRVEIEAKLYRLTKVAENLLQKGEIDGEFERLYKRLKINAKNQRLLISIYNDKCLAAFQGLSKKSAELDKHYQKLRKSSS